jgi:hypothetical protein
MPLQWCKPTFETCETDHRDCCGFKCERDSLGFKRCLAIGGCRVSGAIETSKGELNQFGEICSDNCDCCSQICEADELGVKRCKKKGDPRCDGVDQVCLPFGELCETECECCSGICLPATPPDAAGQFPKRCLHPLPGADPGAGGGSGTCHPDGAECAAPSECCSGLCLPSAGECGFRCGGGGSGGTGGAGVGGAGGGSGTGGSAGEPCVAYGNACTTSSDCCGIGECLPDGKGGLFCGEIVR